MPDLRTIIVLHVSTGELELLGSIARWIGGRTVIKSGHIASSLSSFPSSFRTTFRFSFSNSTSAILGSPTSCPMTAIFEGSSLDISSSNTLPRVNPFATYRFTDVILPVKRRTPLCEERRVVIGSSLRERERAIDRPIVQAARH